MAALVASPMADEDDATASSASVTLYESYSALRVNSPQSIIESRNSDVQSQVRRFVPRLLADGLDRPAPAQSAEARK